MKGILDPSKTRLVIGNGKEHFENITRIRNQI